MFLTLDQQWSEQIQPAQAGLPGVLHAGDLESESIYFFVECLAVIGAVPARYPALAPR